MTKLVEIVITKRIDGKWDVLRRRADNGERCSGCGTLEEALDFVRAHERGFFGNEEEQAASEQFEQDGAN